MWLEELILEGFKSYPVRTQITGFDESFNCITGLNGSGKSNILDSICFVLGLTNMTQVRAANQQDLIYKRGQAGITKASVTAVFNNSDKSKSPPGMGAMAQITVTRQIALPNVSKYLLNGHKSTQQNVQLLFQSVQLNINNPNFLIMQGRITKVLNMRPQEILGLIEEAAGTRMYEERKDKAKKTMAKKEKRVDEITGLLNEEIIPKLDKLRAEKGSFIAYQKRSTEIEKLARLLTAFGWKEAVDRAKRKEADAQRKEEELGALAEQEATRKEQLEAAEAEKKAAIKRREKESAKGGVLQKYESQVTEAEKKIVQLETQREMKLASVADEEERIKTLKATCEELKATKEEKTVTLAQLINTHAELKATFDAAERKYKANQELLQTLQTGLQSESAANTSGGGYLGQLAEAQGRLAAAEANEESYKRELSRIQKDLSDAEAKWKRFEREAGDSTKQLEAGKRAIETLAAQANSYGWSEEKETQAVAALRTASDKVHQLTAKRDNLQKGFAGLDFQYDNPTADFDRRKVKGLVANLIEISEEHYGKSTALEITAGGRLYNVVVDDERTGGQLLDKGRLRKRVTLIPLNKINAFKASAERLRAANKIGKDKVRLALSLVGYEEEVASAMSFVFGNTLICDDAESAKAVTFSREVGMRSVTINGDVYDPSGTISGGSAPSSSGLLVRVQAVKAADRELLQAKAELSRLQQEDQKNANKKAAWLKAKHDLDLKSHEVSLLQEQLSGSSATRAAAEVAALKAKQAEVKQSLQQAQTTQAEAKADTKKLEKDMNEFKNNKDGKLKEIKAETAKQKTALSKLSVELKGHQKEVQTTQLELEQAQSDIEGADENILKSQATIEATRKELGKLEASLEKEKNNLADVTAKLEAERATLSRFDEEVKALEVAIKSIKEALSDLDVSVSKLKHDIQACHKEAKGSQDRVVALEKANPWIHDEKKQFGKAGGMYDYNSVDMQTVKDKAKELEDLQKGMKKKINPKVLNMIDTVEKKEADLKRNLQTVLGDKTKIEQTIEELDRYKLDALEKTWTKVSTDFGDIFADLLPGNSAKLQYADQNDLSQGLEVKVQLGSIWKQSLTELSGGQRSLIALSLIMSLLQFKPAPMYILDEIDAALDLSHTQHIGELFKNRFKGSQFIVVSLKDGLFNNANVLFRTKFRDGTSIVERTTQRSTTGRVAR